MIELNNDIVLVGSSELRTEMPKLAGFLAMKTVIITKKGKPMAVLQDFKEYKQKEALLESFKDSVLGHVAKERELKSKKYLSEATVARRLKISQKF